MCSLRWNECLVLGCEMGHTPTQTVSDPSRGDAGQTCAVFWLIQSSSSLHVSYEGFKGHLFYLSKRSFGIN